MTDTSPRRQALVVIGMHRSGTSAMARVLSLAGAALPRDVMGSSPSNEAGHWEPLPVAEFNDRLLARVDAGWDSTFGPRRNRRGALPLRRYLAEARQILREQYGDEPLIVLKDPRVTLLVDLWHEALVQEGFAPSYVVMIRRPEEVAASLSARDAIPTSRGLLLWATYTSQADILTRQFRRVFCTYDRLLAEPGKVLDEVEEGLGIEFGGRTARSESQTADFLNPSLRHHSAERLDRVSAELAPVARLADYMFDLSAGVARNDDVAAETSGWLASLDAMLTPLLVAEGERRQAALTAVEGLVATLQADIADANGIIAELRERETALRLSLDEHAVALAGREQDVATLRQVLDSNAQAAAEAATLRIEMTRLSQAHAGLAGAHVTALARRELEARKLRADLAAAQSALSGALERGAALETALAAANHDAAVCNAESSKAREAFAVHAELLSSQVVSAEAARHAEAVHKARSEEALATTRDALVEARDALAITRGELDEARERLIREGASLADACSALGMTRKELGEARAMLASEQIEKRQTLAAAEAQRSQAQRQLEEARATAEQERARRDQQRDEYAARLQEAEDRIAQLTAEHGRSLAARVARLFRRRGRS